VAGFRLALAAQRDIEHILTESEVNWGTSARRRYATLIMAAVKRIAADAEARPSREHPDIGIGIRSFHMRHLRNTSGSAVKRPAHILFYRRIDSGPLEIMRILHERMDPAHHIGLASK
jgi:toxin ParE1/3/4